MSLRIQSDTLRSEFSQIVDILVKWKEKLDGGVPGDEIPANEMDVEIFVHQLRGETQLAAERLLAIVEVLDL